MTVSGSEVEEKPLAAGGESVARQPASGLFGGHHAKRLGRALRRTVSAWLFPGLSGECDSPLDMGTPVNCSALKKCGRSDCPAYGRVDHCWVTAGSYSILKSCDHVQNGGHCRDCELFGAADEREELNSMIGAIAIGLRHRKLARSAAGEGLKANLQPFPASLAGGGMSQPWDGAERR